VITFFVLFPLFVGCTAETIDKNRKLLNDLSTFLTIADVIAKE